MSTKSLGHMGEESAAIYLAKNGYEIVGRNVYIGHYEIDIIAKNDTHLVFAEVKTRRTRPGVHSRYGRPSDAVNRQKQACLMSAARQYLRDHAGEYSALTPNIDVIEVYADPTSDTYHVLEIRHFKNAVNGMTGGRYR